MLQNYTLQMHITRSNPQKAFLGFMWPTEVCGQHVSHPMLVFDVIGFGHPQNARDFFFLNLLALGYGPPTRKICSQCKKPTTITQFPLKKEGSRSHRVHEECKRTKPKHLSLLPSLPIYLTPSIATPVLSLPQKEVSWDWRTQCIATVARSCRYWHNTVDHVVDITNVGIKGPRVYF